MLSGFLPLNGRKTGVVGFAETVGGQSAASFAVPAESLMSLSSRADFSSGVDDFISVRSRSPISSQMARVCVVSIVGLSIAEPLMNYTYAVIHNGGRRSRG